MRDATPPDTLYPAGLLRWAGHRDGGVRKPFRQDSGRPTGGRIETPLVARLQKWVSQLSEHGKDAPRTVLLVGGPGNGKTDAIETCVEFLDAAIKAGGALVKAFAAEFEVAEGHLPPRKVVVEPSTLGIPLPPHLRESITLIQDATEGDPALGKPAERLLLEELADRLDPERPGLYLCCVNRGILAHAAVIAQETIGDQSAAQLLDRITAAVTSGPTSPPCWPLSGFAHFAVWPMDVESLVDSCITGPGKTVAHQILACALDPSRWNAACDAGPRCPFCQNREILADTGAVDSLVTLLRYYELASGKRWTFRDLFSLVPYLLVGDYAELEIDGKQVSPCEWSAHQLKLAHSAQSRTPARARAPYLLVSRLYHHRLFPRWPGLDRGEHRKAKKILQDSSFLPALDFAGDFFRYLSHAGSHPGGSSGEVLGRVRDSLCVLLDPALAPVDTVLLKTGGEEITTEQVEERFSISVRDGLGLVSRQLQALERDLLKTLADADDAMVEENFPRTKSHHAKLLQGSLRQFCARLVKRSLGTRRAVCRDAHYFESYERALRDRSELGAVRRQVRNMLHDDRNQFRASLATTFGQPVAQRSRDIVLLTPVVSVKEFVADSGPDRPAEPFPYLQVDRHIVPLTFSLFKALREVVGGLHDASLPAEIFALMNGIKSLVSGGLVRDREVLEDGSRIELGSSGYGFEIRGDLFHLLEVGLQ